MRKFQVGFVVALALAGTATALPATAAGADAVITSRLTGAQAVPGPGDENGKGDFAATLTRNTMCYSLSVRRVGEAMMAHIHVGERGVAGEHVIMLMTPDKAGVQECIAAVPDEVDTPDTMSVTELALLKSAPEGFYVNVHTHEFHDGAIRGQLKDGRN